jgi:NhaP-type Na+/H+ and K+/H+ antiporter
VALPAALDQERHSNEMDRRRAPGEDADALGASSFIAVYLAGLRLGNARLPHEVETRTFAEGLALLSQIGPLVLLGLLVSPSALPDAIFLATLPVSAGIPAATQVFNVVFVLVVILTLVQAPVLPRLARALRVDGLTVTRVPVPNATRVELVVSEDLPVVGLRLADLDRRRWRWRRWCATARRSTLTRRPSSGEGTAWCCTSRTAAAVASTDASER